MQLWTLPTLLKNTSKEKLDYLDVWWLYINKLPLDVPEK